MMKYTFLAAALIGLCNSGGAQSTLKTHKDSLSYALGVSLAESLKRSGITDYNDKIFMEAVQASLNNKATMSSADADRLYREENKRITEERNKEAQKAGIEWLEKNKKNPGVKTTASGLQYKETLPGKGIAPDANDRVTVHYHGTLTDGTVFDSSVERGQPATFGLNQVITGWTEGLQLMKEGGKTTFYIPQALAYGARAQGKIPAFSTLVFDVELIKVEKVD